MNSRTSGHRAKIAVCSTTGLFGFTRNAAKLWAVVNGGRVEFARPRRAWVERITQRARISPGKVLEHRAPSSRSLQNLPWALVRCVTFFVALNRRVGGLTGADADDITQVRDENLPIAHLPGTRG